MNEEGIQNPTNICHSQHGHNFFYVLIGLIQFLVFSTQQHSILVLQEVYYTLLYFGQLLSLSIY